MGKASEFEKAHDAEYLRKLFDYDPESGVLAWKVRNSNRVHVGEVAGSTCDKGYVHVKVDGVTVKAHRIAWCIATGDWPSGQIDHIDQCRSSNVLSNLRDVSQSVNQRNAKKRANNTSGFTGVHWNKPSRKWLAQVKLGDKQLYLGLFTSYFDACVAARNARLELGFSERHAGQLPPKDGLQLDLFGEAA
jgi:hypothetical protein